MCQKNFIPKQGRLPGALGPAGSGRSGGPLSARCLPHSHSHSRAHASSDVSAGQPPHGRRRASRPGALPLCCLCSTNRARNVTLPHPNSEKGPLREPAGPHDALRAPPSGVSPPRVSRRFPLPLAPSAQRRGKPRRGKAKRLAPPRPSPRAPPGMAAAGAAFSIRYGIALVARPGLSPTVPHCLRQCCCCCSSRATVFIFVAATQGVRGAGAGAGGAGGRRELALRRGRGAAAAGGDTAVPVVAGRGGGGGGGGGRGGEEDGGQAPQALRRRALCRRAAGSPRRRPSRVWEGEEGCQEEEGGEGQGKASARCHC